MTKKFSIKEAIRVGWKETKKDFGFFFVLLLIVLLLVTLAALIDPTRIAAVIFVALAVIAGLIRVALKQHDRHHFQVADFFVIHPYFHRFLLSAILYHLIVLLGLVLLIVPGIIWAIQFKFYGYFIVEGAGPIEALRLSSRITRGAKWDLFWFNVILIGIMILGILALLVGLFVAIPLIMVSTAHVYRELLKKS